jgi:hypothetical protein
MNFFFDADISWRFSNMIKSLEEGNHIVTHITQDERFSHNNNQFGNSTPDTEWLTVLGKDQAVWKVISGDTSIIDTAHERAALTESGLTFFAFDASFHNANRYEQAAKLIRIWTEIVRYASVPEQGIYRVRTGKRPGIDIIRSGMRTRGGRFPT